MKISSQTFFLGLLSALASTATAAEGDPTLPDFANWKCEACKFESGTSGSVDVGVGSVSDKSAEFGQYNGLHKKGGFFIGDADLRSRGEDGSYWKLDASNLGLDTRTVKGEAGKQGSYKLKLDYDETTHRIWDGAQTPYSGSGTAKLTLPAGFAAATTTAMPLAGAMQGADLFVERKQIGVGATWNRTTQWEYAVNVRHETREGNILRTGGAFFVNSTQLVEPVDYVTDQVDASASYAGKKFQMKLAYYGSKFKNSNQALTWDNPYTPLAGETQGRLALAPDNQFHQVAANLGYQFSDKTRFSGDIAVGRMTQNDGFLPYAVTVAGPGGSLNGRAATMDAALKLSSAVTEKLRLNAAYTYNERDNQTPQASYLPVTTDLPTFVATTPRTNLPYSFRQEKFKLSGDYRFTPDLRASVGTDFDTMKRTYQEVDTTNENTVWGKLNARVMDKVDLTFKLARGERRLSGTYQVVPGVTPPENPLMRKYNMANRTRDTLGVRADFPAGERINIGLGFDSSEDSYSDSSIGLTGAKDTNLNGDVTFVLSEAANLHFFANHQEINSQQAGSAIFAAPDWSANYKDTIDTYGLGIKYKAIPDKLDIGADYAVTRSHSRISVNDGSGNPDFPHLTGNLDSLRLYATYKLKDNWSLQAGYWMERYDSRDWMLDGVATNTISNMLTMGLGAPQYRVNVLRMALRYKF